MSGLNLWRVENRIVVYSVQPHSPANRAGIKKEDVVLKVNGRAVDEYGLFAIRRLLRGPENERIVLRIERGQRKITKWFWLKRPTN